MSLSPPDDETFPDLVIDEKEPIVSNLKQVLPADVKIKVSDGEIWANKALLTTSSDYFSAMLDGEKFQEGQEGVGNLELYTKEVVSKVIDYFYSGRMSCKVKLVNLRHFYKICPDICQFVNI